MTYTKRAVALLLALMMVFTGAVQAFAATQMTMAVIALPRSADTNKGDWGLAELYLMGGWETIETDNYLVYFNFVYFVSCFCVFGQMGESNCGAYR